MKNKILDLLTQINNLIQNPTEDTILPQGVFYLNDCDILCTERKYGESRYPYEMDGMTMWAHSTGYINACESTLTYFRTSSLKEETCIDFWGGIKTAENKYNPISILGPCRQLLEDETIKRYTVFSSRCVYYITETDEIVFAVRGFVTSDKKMSFKICAISKTDNKKEIYLTSFMEPLLRYSEDECFWGSFSRYGKLYDNGGFTVSTRQNVDNIAVIIKKSSDKCDSTVAKGQFLGKRGRNLTNADVLKTGKFEKQIKTVNSTDLPIVSDIMRTTLSDYAEIEYLITFTHEKNEADILINQEIKSEELEKDILLQEEEENKKLSSMHIEFGKLHNTNVGGYVFNRFLKNVQKQVDFCALGKNYAGDMIGIRDVFQQLESALMWNMNGAREKILTALGYIMSNGRAPRQFSIPPRKDIIPKFDMRQFIDQGLWIVSALHSYLCFTDDYSILDEKCSYYEIIDEKNKLIKLSDKEDTVLEHLINIMGYLISNIDEDTDCLKILYGDWNDAVCGLGKSMQEEEFGNGVSIMASLQLYDCLNKAADILRHIGKYDANCESYYSVRERLANGINKHAFETGADGIRHIVHGWGDKMSYRVGSLCDSDGACRYSINSNSFWCLSDMILRDKTFKKDILFAYDKLDSKYGLKTFYPHFPYDMEGVGRITATTPGTFENGSTYVHATLFAAAALFKMGEPEKAWEQLIKVMPITHSNESMTPFVMPNSYCYNEEYNIDGESMGDWFTGSGTVFIRNIIKYALGVQPNLDGLKIEIPKYMPVKSASLKLKIKDAEITLVYNDKNNGIRNYFVNSKKQDTLFDELSENEYAFVENGDLHGQLLIEIFD